MPRLGHAVKSRIPKALRRVFEIGQRFGVNITPNHFYSEIPDIRHLRTTTYWRKPYSMHGVRGAAIDPQLDFVRRVAAPYAEHVRDNHLFESACAVNGEIGYGPIEAAFLYCYIRAEKPPRIIQVGCGVSTALILHAAADEPDYKPDLICVEPFPTKMLREKAAAGEITLIPKMMQEVPREQMTDLGEGGLLFVDSSHSLRIGSEVVQIISEIMPRLSPGTRVHFHDITFPYDYPTGLFGSRLFFFREVALLYAFLVCNERYTIEASLSMLHHERLPEMIDLFPSYKPRRIEEGIEIEHGDFPSSIFLRVS